MSKLLYRLGHFAVRRRRTVLAAWALVMVVMGVLAATVGGATSSALTIPGTESQQANDLLQERFPARSGSAARVVFAAPDGDTLDSLGLEQSVTDTLTAIAAQPDVIGVTDPYTTGAISPDGAVAFADVQYATSASLVSEEALDALSSTAQIAEPAGVRVEFGGEVNADQPESAGHTGEIVGLAIAVVVLLVTFGSIIAMGLPLLTAMIGVGIGMLGITVLAGFTDLAETAPILATMIGLAVGIDYALFIVTRHRQNLAEGHDVAEAAARANATAGGAVVFAGLTVVIALAGLTVVGIPFLGAMGVAASFTVLVAILIAITLIPATLGFAGHNIDRFRIGHAHTGTHDEQRPTLSARWAKQVADRPTVSLAAGVIFMGVLAIPALSLRLGMPDAGSNSPSTSSRQAYDLLATGFGPGFNGPLTIVADLDESTEPRAAVNRLTAALAAEANVLDVSTPTLNPAGDTAVLSVTPRSGPATAHTDELIHHLRSDVLPGVETATGANVTITGSTAATIDVADKLSAALPKFMVIVIGLTLILLLVAFRSILIPLKAGLAILLSIAASFGVVVAIFQWGWMKDVIGLQETVPIISFLPILMFAILFGLSMDYEVFIVSRIREEYTRTDDAHRSVVLGLSNSARVITAAALIMISVFAGFVVGDNPVIKMFGIGLSVAVLLDATVVRMMIVPAVISLLDHRAWYLPRWLDRALPNLDVEGQHLVAQLVHRETASTSTEAIEPELCGQARESISLPLSRSS
jgi:putative drug exporter of the RND superfamily